MINLIKRFFGFFDDNGLKHSINTLENVKKEITELGIAELCKYADEVCVMGIKNDSFVKEMMDSVDEFDIQQYKGWNTTSLGNISYVCIYANEENVRDKAKRLIITYKVLFKYKKVFYLKDDGVNCLGCGTSVEDEILYRTLPKGMQGHFHCQSCINELIY